MKREECFNCLIGWPSALSFPRIETRTVADDDPHTFGPFALGDIVAVFIARADAVADTGGLLELSAANDFGQQVAGRFVPIVSRDPYRQLFRIQYDDERFIAFRRLAAASYYVTIYAIGNVNQRSFKPSQL